MSEQGDNLDRVTARIGVAIVTYFKLKELACQSDYHVEDLRVYVRQRVGMIAPGSADRVMRALRQDGIINYKCLRRSESLYRILPARFAVEKPRTQGELF
jgi:hypothetical protein